MLKLKKPFGFHLLLYWETKSKGIHTGICWFFFKVWYFHIWFTRCWKIVVVHEHGHPEIHCYTHMYMYIKTCIIDCWRDTGLQGIALTFKAHSGCSPNLLNKEEKLPSVESGKSRLAGPPPLGGWVPPSLSDAPDHSSVQNKNFLRFGRGSTEIPRTIPQQSHNIHSL